MTEPDDDDGWQAYKDDLAMGYINPDGSQREPNEPDWEEDDAQPGEPAAAGRLALADPGEPPF